MSIGFDCNITRRSVVLAGLGAVLFVPISAMADVVTKVGYKADGTPWSGLVTVEGKTYLYEAGEKFCGGQREFHGSRYFHKDGHMAVDEDVEWSDGTKHHYGTDGLLKDVAKKSGWVTDDDGVLRYYEDGKYLAGCERAIATDASGAKVDPAPWYYFQDDGSLAHGWRYLADNDKWVYYDLASGKMLKGEAYVPCNNEVGAQCKWYLFDQDTGACTYGWATLGDGRTVYYHKTEGWMFHGWADVDHGTYRFDENTGKVADWFDNGWGGGYIVNSGIGLCPAHAGHEVDLGREAIAKLAVRVASTVQNPHRVGSANVWDASLAPAGKPAQEYIKICDTYTKAYHTTSGDSDNPAYASCTQAVGHIVRAVVDPNFETNSTEQAYEYLRNSGIWDYVGTFGPGCKPTFGLLPGDVLTNDSHTIMWVGNDLVRQKYPDSTANIFEADVGTGLWPNLDYQDEHLSNYPGYTFDAYRWNGGLSSGRRPYQNVYKLLGDGIEMDSACASE